MGETMPVCPETAGTPKLCSSHPSPQVTDFCARTQAVIHLCCPSRTVTLRRDCAAQAPLKCISQSTAFICAQAGTPFLLVNNPRLSSSTRTHLAVSKCAHGFDSKQGRAYARACIPGGPLFVPSRGSWLSAIAPVPNFDASFTTSPSAPRSVPCGLGSWNMKHEAGRPAGTRAPDISPCARTAMRTGSATNRARRARGHPAAQPELARSRAPAPMHPPPFPTPSRAERALSKHSLPRVLSSRPCSRDARVGRARRGATAGVRRPPRREGA
ncbi:hypothetical protein B0H15DRAFT_344456 [Mycena belliarum]|uniref:Uncharacterized protein n=1 Tax=Mycena belliarum TaxID=1033014 RepID=A0AAD6XTT3_9AGAR|nr:hypothetical protein B0H15DRAFT_344456 [Mycena belliae]